MPPRIAPLEPAALWTCPDCRAKFTTKNQWHSCGVFNLDDLFEGCEPHVRHLFDKFVSIARTFGPVTVFPQKSRVAIQVRMRFAALMPQKSALKGHLVLARRCESTSFEKVETYSPRNHVHVFRVRMENEFTPEFQAIVGEAYKVGCQEHLAEPRGPRGRR